MFGYLILLFTVLPALELYVLIQIGTVIGAGNTLLVIILTGIIGAYLARLQGFLVFNRIQSELKNGNVPSGHLLDGLMILLGGIVLLTPGFITDSMGILLLIPWSRSLIKFWLQKKFEHMVRQGHIVHISPFQSRNPDDDYDDIDIN